MMKRLALVRRTAALFLFSIPAAFASPQAAPIQPQQIGDTHAVTVTPQVPVAAGAPCVVTLVQDQRLIQTSLPKPTSGQARYSYMPPAGCHAPWAKVVLQVDVDEDETGPGRDVAKAYVRLGGIELFEGSTSELPSSSWRAERDVTDLAPLLAGIHNGQVALVPENELWLANRQGNQILLSARLLFYPASAATPAPKTPDGAYRVLPQAHSLRLPHNIVRAYLDVYNQRPWWFTCLPDADLGRGSPFWSALAMGGEMKGGISVPQQGCGGGGFEEIQVSIDGTPAGVVPAYPLLSADFNYYYSDTVNAPIQPPQMTNYIPYRADLTPFAAILNEAGEHTISLSQPVTAYLLVYRDRHARRVSGAVTLNTLAGSSGAPTVHDTLAPVGDTMTGQVTTGLDRDFKIKGFVNTSHGRVYSTVHQTSHFDNRQVFYLDGLQYPEYRHYRQYVALASRTQQHSRRTRAGQLLEDDVRIASYPLELAYDMDGYVYETDDSEAAPSKGTASVSAHWDLDSTYWQRRFGRYESHVRQSLISSRTHDILANQDSDWQARAHFRFGDSQGSCYQSHLDALDGAVTAETQGVGCGGVNHVRWFAHPDGSPDSLGWMH